MEVYVNEIRGLADAMCTLFLSKRNLTRDKEERIREVVCGMTTLNGSIIKNEDISTVYNDNDSIVTEFNKYRTALLKYGVKHTTLLRFVDFSCSVYGFPAVCN